MGKKVLVLLPYPPGRAPSQRFRIEHFLPILEESGHHVEVQSFLDPAGWEILYQPGRVLQKSLGLLRGFSRRYSLLLRLHHFDLVWVHRETAPLGLPLLAFLIMKVWRKRVIFEFDDAVWLPNVSHSNRFFGFLKPHRNARYLMRNSYCNVGGNRWLVEQAQKYHPHAVLLPTVVDTEKAHAMSQNQEVEQAVVGWTGSHSTLPYLADLAPLLREVHARIPFRLIVISDLAPDFDFPDLVHIPWRKSTEVQDLMNMHIGLMPLPNEPWALGKCAFKLVQYMSLGIVPLASAVGANKDIVKHRENGLLVDRPEEWVNSLIHLLEDHAFRIGLSAGCRPLIQEQYSVRSQRSNFLHLFDF